MGHATGLLFTHSRTVGVLESTIRVDTVVIVGGCVDVQYIFALYVPCQKLARIKWWNADVSNTGVKLSGFVAV